MTGWIRIGKRYFPSYQPEAIISHDVGLYARAIRHFVSGKSLLVLRGLS